MKKLKRILLINWLYFSKELIEFGDISFLTGKNGSGKSTIIDALQIILLGETNSRNFNKAANEKSTRTLEGYLRTDLDSKHPESRKGKDFSTYIVGEFYDDVEKQSFCQGIIYDCYSDGNYRYNYFSYEGAIPEHRFIHSKRAMDIPALRSYIKEHYGLRGKLYDSNTQYQHDLLARWNVHIASNQLFRMLKKAVSFQPITNIQTFITENICDVQNKLDIELMQQNIRDYKDQEKLEQRQEKELATLVDVNKIYDDWQKSSEKLKECRFLIFAAQKKDVEEKVTVKTVELQERQQHLTDLLCRQEELTGVINEQRQERDQLIHAKACNEMYREQQRLLDLQKRRSEEQAKLYASLNRAVNDLNNEADFVAKIVAEGEIFADWKEFSVLQKALQQTGAAYQSLGGCSMDIFAQGKRLFSGAYKLTASLKKELSSQSYAVEQTMKQLKQEHIDNEQILIGLRENIKDYHKELLQLQAYLISNLGNKYRKNIEVLILADVLEIKEGQEAWRGAVEAYLNTQKFYLLVEPEYYEDALLLFDKVKHQYTTSLGLVDIGKLRVHEKIVPQNNSLAHKVETTNTLARCYIDYVLGRVICCERVQDIRNHKIALTASGMLYQGYVARQLPRRQMEDAFIGRRSVALRIEVLNKRQTELQERLEQMQPLLIFLKNYGQREYLFTRRYVDDDVTRFGNEYTQGVELANLLKQIEEQLDELDMFWLEQLEHKLEQINKYLEQLEEEIKLIASEQGSTEAVINRIKTEALPELYRQSAEQDNLLAEFSEEYKQSVGWVRYEAELKRLKSAAKIVANFNGQYEKLRKDNYEIRQHLLTSRANYLHDFPNHGFAIDGISNDEYLAEQARIEESELPKYKEKIKKARESALEQFRNEFLNKLKANIEQVQRQVRDLNKALEKAQFGTDKYKFIVKKAPDYEAYYEMIMSPDLMSEEEGLFAQAFQDKYAPLIEELFSRISSSDDVMLNARKQSELEQNIERYTDYRTYLLFDLEVTDRNGTIQSLAKTMHSKSGGETQTPFYIAVLASFAQIYQVGSASEAARNTARIIFFDEAFNKMDSERICESIRLLRKLGLQAIICTPPDKLPDIVPLSDNTLLVCNDKYRMNVLDYSKRKAGNEEWLMN